MKNLVETVLDVVIFGRNSPALSYRALESEQSEVSYVARRVLVDLRGKVCLGVVVGVHPSAGERSSFTLKPILHWVDEVPLFSLKNLESFRRLARYYLYAEERIFLSILPSWLTAFSLKSHGVKVFWSFKRKACGHFGFIRSRWSSLESQIEGGGEQPLECFCKGREELIPATVGKVGKGLPFLGSPEIYFGTEDERTGFYETFFFKRFPGSQGLLLLPETSLVEPWSKRLSSKGLPTFSYHSGLSTDKKRQVWEAVYQGVPLLVCGTRSALYLPYRNLGALVVDEEESQSHKELRGMRVQARDAALMIAKHQGSQICLGAFTPSLETYHRFKQGQTGVEASKGSDPGEEKSLSAVPVLVIEGDIRAPRSLEKLVSVVKKSLDVGKSVLLLLNKKGFFTRLGCSKCAQPATCEACGRPFAFYRYLNQLRCSACRKQSVPSFSCRHCRGVLRPLGLGTEGLEGVLGETLRDYPIFRLDSGTVKNRAGVSKFLKGLEKIEGGKLCIGTEIMLRAREALDWGLVSLLGYDEGWYSLDLRAEERFCQVYTQAKAFIGQPGASGALVVVTRFPSHPILQSLKEGGYYLALKRLLKERESEKEFPFLRWAHFFCEAGTRQRAEKTLLSIQHRLHGSFTPEEQGMIRMVGPMPSDLKSETIQKRWTFQVGAEALLLQKKLRAPEFLAFYHTLSQGKGIRLWLERDS